MENKLSNSIILITGGAGNIGSYIVDKILLYNPKLCIVVDNMFNSGSYKINSSDIIKYYSLDISNQDEMEYIYDKYRPKYVFHCASMLIQDSEALPRKSINTNIIGTFNIVDLSNKYKIDKICYSSSASVYGEPKSLPVKEVHPYAYDNFVYGWTKITAEMIFLSHAKVKWLGFRYYNVYSERMNQGAFYTQIFPIFYNSIKNGEELIIYGDGNQTMDLIHAEDIAEANIMGVNSAVSNEYFNVGNGISTSVNELAYVMMEKMGKKVNIQYVEKDVQKVKNRKSCTKKIFNMLGYKPRITLEYGIQRYIKNKENRNDKINQ